MIALLFFDYSRWIGYIRTYVPIFAPRFSLTFSQGKNRSVPLWVFFA